MFDEQRAVASFVAEHDLEAAPTHRILDLASEVGEIASEATESTEYGESTADLEVPPDELGDALFSLLAVCDALGVDAEEALEAPLAKYRRRLEETGSPASSE